MTAEEIGFAAEQLFEGGALDVFTIPIGMKKSRPGTLLCTLCKEQDKERIVRLIFKYTTTLGLRETIVKRYTLDRTIKTVNTAYGEIRKKNASGYGISRSKFEYEDLAEAARANNLSISELKEKIL